VKTASYQHERQLDSIRHHASGMSSSPPSDTSRRYTRARATVRRSAFAGFP